VSLTRLTAGVGFVRDGLPRDAFSPLVHCAIFAAATAALLLPEFRFPVALAALGGASLATRIIQDAAIFGDPGYLAASPPYSQVMRSACARTPDKVCCGWPLGPTGTRISTAFIAADRARGPRCRLVYVFVHVFHHSDTRSCPHRPCARKLRVRQ
jgi:hypothetical protein